MRGLLRRKLRIGRSRGVSTVIGTVFFVIITLLVATNVFLWSTSQQNLYNLAAIQCNQMDADRINEKVTIISGDHSVTTPGGGQLDIVVILKNEGPVSSQILTLWVIDETLEAYTYIPLASDNINLAPGNLRLITESVTIPGCQDGDNYDIWFVTARGNPVLFKQIEYLTYYNIVNAMGPVHVTFNSLEWFSTVDNSSGTFTIPADKKSLTWSIVVTNYGNYDIMLNSNSAFWIIDFSQAGKSRVWYLGEPPEISTYLLPREVPVTISFRWDNANPHPPYNPVTQTLPGTGTYITMITLLGNYDDPDSTHFGETIPFEAILATAT